MLSNTKVVAFVNRVASDAQLREALNADFEGTLKTHELELSTSETEALKASYRYLSQVNPMELEGRIAAAGSNC